MQTGVKGAHGFTVTNLAELKDAMKQINDLQKAGDKLPVVLDAKIQNIDPIDTSFIPVDPAVFDADMINNYRQTYALPANEQPAFSEILKNI